MMRTILIVLCAIISLSAWTQAPPLPSIMDVTTANGSAVLIPAEAVAATYGTWTLTFTVGEDGIQQGGGIRVQMPDEWHAGPRNSANKLQTQDPADNNYITALTSNDMTKIRCVVEFERENILIKHAKQSLDRRNERYVFVVRVLVEDGNLSEGDTVSVVYGNRSGGSAGYRASTVSTPPLPVLIGVDENGDNKFKLLEDKPTLTVLPDSAVDMMVHVRSQAVVGEPIEAVISLVDKEANPVHHTATIDLFNHTGESEFPKTVKVPSQQGFVRVEVMPTHEGVVRLRARTKDFELEAISNPMLVSEEEPKQKIYWGDLHSHSHYSWDGVGRNNFEYARDISALDFYAMTDHAIYPSHSGITRGLAGHNWEEYTALSNQYNDPHNFVALAAYECSFGKPYGHHNVIFRGEPGVLDYPDRTELPKLWERLQDGNALTIPHHTGKFPGGVDLTIHDERFQRNFEMYSGHGLSEMRDPSHPLAFEQSLFTSDGSSVDDPTYLQDAWRMGLEVSAIAASDDHRAQPGKPQYGLAAVWAPELTRDGIFNGLHRRNTYATTGAKIILEFSANESQQHKIRLAEDLPELNVRAIGTDVIDWVEILRLQPGATGFEVVKRWEPDAWEFEEVFRDVNAKVNPEYSVYYCRMQQKKWVRGRPVMAWSSPVFVKMVNVNIR